MPPRISVSDPDEVEPEVKAVFDRFMRVRGNIPNMFRTYARRPKIMLTMEAHMNAIFQTGTVEFALKEMCAVRTSANNHCAY
jgi:alkylhydroperoxidase family enzyme